MKTVTPQSKAPHVAEAWKRNYGPRGLRPDWEEGREDTYNRLNALAKCLTMAVVAVERMSVEYNDQECPLSNADEVRNAMDSVWRLLSSEEQDHLSERTGDVSDFAGGSSSTWQRIRSSNCLCLARSMVNRGVPVQLKIGSEGEWVLVATPEDIEKHADRWADVCGIRRVLEASAQESRAEGPYGFEVTDEHGDRPGEVEVPKSVLEDCLFRLAKTLSGVSFSNNLRRVIKPRPAGPFAPKSKLVSFELNQSIAQLEWKWEDTTDGCLIPARVIALYFGGVLREPSQSSEDAAAAMSQGELDFWQRSYLSALRTLITQDPRLQQVRGNQSD